MSLVMLFPVPTKLVPLRPARPEPPLLVTVVPLFVTVPPRAEPDDPCLELPFLPLPRALSCKVWFDLAVPLMITGPGPMWCGPLGPGINVPNAKTTTSEQRFSMPQT